MTTIIFKIFYEKTYEDYEKYNKLWDEHRERMIFLQDHLPFLKQARCFRDDISDNKDILSIRFPTRKFFTRNKIFNNIISGKGFYYSDNRIWHPKEVWIYSPLSH